MSLIFVVAYWLLPLRLLGNPVRKEPQLFGILLTALLIGVVLGRGPRSNTAFHSHKAGEQVAMLSLECVSPRQATVWIYISCHAQTYFGIPQCLCWHWYTDLLVTATSMKKGLHDWVALRVCGFARFDMQNLHRRVGISTATAIKFKVRRANCRTYRCRPLFSNVLGVTVIVLQVSAGGCSWLGRRSVGVLAGLQSLGADEHWLFARLGEWLPDRLHGRGHRSTDIPVACPAECRASRFESAAVVPPAYRRTAQVTVTPRLKVANLEENKYKSTGTIAACSLALSQQFPFTSPVYPAALCLVAKSKETIFGVYRA